MKTFLKQATPEEREELALKVESSVAYFYQIAGGHKKPGTDLCKALVENEPKLTLHELRPDVWFAPAETVSDRRRDREGKLAVRETETVGIRGTPKVLA